MSINPLFAVMANIDIPKPPVCPGQTTSLSSLSSNLVAPADIQAMYLYTIPAHTQPSHFALVFTSAENMEYVRRSIEKNLQDALKDPELGFLLTREFVTVVLEMLQFHGAATGNVNTYIQAYNNQLIQNETDQALLSHRHSQRHHKWNLLNDRIKVMPYGYSDQTEHVRGERPISTAAYQVTHPDARRHQQFLQQVLGIPPRPPC